jgi:hypothetical protein
VPSITWDALTSHIRDPVDIIRLADSAEGRLLYRYAIPLYRRAAEAGEGGAAWQLDSPLVGRGDLDELRARADAGDEAAASHLADLLANRGDLDELRARADAGGGAAASQLAEVLAGRGDLDGAVEILQALAAAGRGDVGRLAELLTRHGRDEEAEQLRWFGLNPDGSIASRWLSGILACHPVHQTAAPAEDQE